MRAMCNAPRLRNERGAAAVEFALIASILMMIISAVIEFGFAFNELQVMTSAAREGARYAAVRNDVSEILDRIDEAVVDFSTTNTPQVAVSGATIAGGEPCTDDTYGEPVTVSWEQEIEIEVLMLDAFTRSVDIESTFRCE